MSALTPLLLLALAAVKPNPYLAQAKGFFHGGEYKQCLKRIEQAQRWESSVEEQVEVAIYSGLCNLQVRNAKEAESDFALALKLDPNVHLPPLSSPKAFALLESLRPQAAQPATQEPPKEQPPQEQPPKEQDEIAPVTPSPRDARRRVAEPESAKPPVEATEPVVSRHVPVLPFVVAGISLVGFGIGAGFGASAHSLDAQAQAAVFQSDAVAMHGQAQTSATVANVCFALASAVALTALVLFIVLR
jgi:hypothetical protein